MSWQGMRDLTSLGISLKIQKGREQDFSKNFYFKPGDRKRLLTVLIVCLIFCNSFLMPIRKADAIVAAIPVGIEIGAGAYVVAALGVAAIAGGLGYVEYEDEINAHAARIWDTANQAVKDSLLATYTAAINAGDATMTISADVASWLQQQYAYVVASGSVKAEVVDSTTTSKISMTTRSITAYWGYEYYFKPATGYGFLYPGIKADTVLSTGAVVLEGETSARGYFRDVSAVSGPRISSPRSASATKQNLQTMYDLAIGTLGLSLITQAQWDNIKARSDLKDYFAGPIAVPQPNDFVAYPKDQVGNPDVAAGPLVYQPDAKTWRDTAKGVDVPVKDIAWAVPVPDIYPIKDATGVATGELGVSVPITTATSTVATPVNVRTAEKTQVEAGTANPPLDWASQPTTAINWAPLKTAAGAFTKKFPFSIPWDVGRQLAIFDVQPKTPVWKVDTWVDMPNFGTGIKNDIHLKWALDLVFFDPFMPLFRWFVIIVADVGLMLSLRRFLPE